MIEYNLDSYGQPKIVDMTEPEKPKYLNTPVNLCQVSNESNPTPGVSWKNASGREKVLFASYLARKIYPETYGEEYMQVAGTDIFEMFDEDELQYYFKRWKKNQ